MTDIRPVSLFDLVSPDRTAPCELNQQDTSGMGDDWPGSPCLIEDELCLTCSAKTAEGKRMTWEDGRPTGVLPLPVEILTRTGWSAAGYYAGDRADQMVELLNAEGAIARAGGDIITDTRLAWEAIGPYDPDVMVGTAYGDMRLFVLSRVEPPDEWLLRSAVPADTNSMRRFDAEITATDAAERVLAAFIARIKAL